ncbi:MAG: L,D-transpeptidase [Acidimicrobiales bacterium]
MKCTGTPTPERTPGEGLAAVAFPSVLWRWALPVAVGAALTACSGGQGPRPAVPRSVATTTTTAVPAPKHQSVVAAAAVPSLQVFATPDVTAPAETLSNPRPLGGPLVLLVTTQRPGWNQVLLPIRPNGSTGWVRSADVTLSAHDYWIVVALHAHAITVYENDTVIDHEPIGVGTGATPTPGGLFYTEDFIKLTDPGGPYGPYAYGLSGFSDVLTTFGGGPGQLAIHGTNEPWALGHDVSHGCIRMSNAGITKLAAILPRGVPVHVVA